jgi:hypothetical protein
MLNIAPVECRMALPMTLAQTPNPHNGPAGLGDGRVLCQGREGGTPTVAASTQRSTPTSHRAATITSLPNGV